MFDEDTLTHEDLSKVRDCLRRTTTFSKKGLADKLEMSYTKVDYLIDLLVGKREVKRLEYGLFKTVLPMSKYGFRKAYGG